MSPFDEPEALDFMTEVDPSGVGTLWIAPSGRTLFAGTGNGEVVELSALTGEFLTSFRVTTSDPALGRRILQSCSADADRTMIAWATGGGDAGVMRTESHSMIWRHEERQPMAMAWCALDPRGRGLWRTAAPTHAFVEFPTHVVLVDIASGRELADLRRRRGSFTGMSMPGLGAVALSGDGQLLALGYRDGTIDLFDAIRFKRIGHKRAHWDLVSACAFSPDGRYLVTGGYRQSPHMKAWSLPGLSEVKEFGGHPGGVWSCAMSPDCETIASGGEKGTIALSDLRGNRRERVLEGHASEVTALAFAPDGSRLISASSDGTVRAWAV